MRITTLRLADTAASWGGVDCGPIPGRRRC